MSPPPAAAAAAAIPSSAIPDRGFEVPGRPPALRVVDRRRRGRSAHRAAPRRVAVLISIGVLMASLLSVVVGHDMLAQGQVRLTGIQSALTSAQDAQRQEIVSVARLETPSRIVGEAEQQLHMVSPGQIYQLPYVSLDVPLPTPKVGPAPGVSAGTPAASGG